jgi:hypothetical protein
MMLSSSSGSESSKMVKMAVFLVSPIKILMELKAKATKSPT